MKTRNLTQFALRSVAVLAAATALMSAANASTSAYGMARGIAPIASSAGTVFNPDAAGIDLSKASI